MASWNLVEQEQQDLCKRVGAIWERLDPNSLIAYNESLFAYTNPINGLRHPKEKKIDGWYLWSGGEIPQNDDNFFRPIHVSHLIQKRPIVLKYLGMPPGCERMTYPMSRLTNQCKSTHNYININILCDFRITI